MNYFIAFFGSVLYNFALLKMSKDKSDAQDKPFDIKKFCSKKWEDWVLATLLAPVLVWFMPQLILVFKDHVGVDLLPYDKALYLGAGPAMEFLVIGIFLLTKYKNKFIPTGHDED